MPAMVPARKAGMFGDDLQHLAVDDQNVHLVWADSRAEFQSVWYGRVPLASYPDLVVPRRDVRGRVSPPGRDDGMKTFARHVQRLRRQFAPGPNYVQNPRERLRLIVAAMDHDLSLATSTCSRTLCTDGTLLELINLDGIRGDLSDEALDRFVSGFLVKSCKGRGE
jgi:hypothetical protein